MENVKLVITDDKTDLAKRCKSVFKNYDIDTIICPKNGRILIEVIKKQKPQIVLAEMFMLELDIFDVVKQIKNLKHKPIITVMSAFDSYEIQKEMNLAGVGYLFLKPFDINSVALKILKIYEKSEFYERTEKTKNELKIAVTKILHQIGVPASIKGYRYLREGVVQAVNDRSLLDAITKGLYPKIAEVFEVSPARVERAIRHAIEIAWERGSPDVLEKYFGYTVDSQKGKPTNSEFIAMICDEISLTLKRNF